MSRAFLVALSCLSLAAPLRAEDVDPEPPANSSVAKSGDYVVSADKDGNVFAKKQQQLVWKGTLQDGASGPSQVAIDGGRVVFARAGYQTVLELPTGKTL
jgi:hypothetical protein